MEMAPSYEELLTIFKRNLNIDEEKKEKRRIASKKYYDKVKNLPEFRIKRKNRNDQYREKVRIRISLK
jgi:hypothetical protein